MKTNDTEVRKRLRDTLIKYSVIFGIGIAYLALVLTTGIGIPCIFSKITGLKCVGCGLTRMLVSAVRLDFAAAFAYNPFLFVTGPFLLAFVVFSEIKYIKTGNRRLGKWELFLWAELILAIVFGISRNIFPI